MSNRLRTTTRQLRRFVALGVVHEVSKQVSFSVRRGWKHREKDASREKASILDARKCPISDTSRMHWGHGRGPSKSICQGQVRGCRSNFLRFVFQSRKNFGSPTLTALIRARIGYRGGRTSSTSETTKHTPSLTLSAAGIRCDAPIGLVIMN